MFSEKVLDGFCVHQHLKSASKNRIGESIDGCGASKPFRTALLPYKLSMPNAQKTAYFIELFSQENIMFALESALRHARPTTEARAVNFSDTWVNELKSTMKLTQRGNEVTGSYESAVSSEKGDKATGVLHGYVNGDLISFVVRWDKFDAITAWVGQLDQTGGTLVTLWQMTKQVDIGTEWSSINTGTDTFTRIS